MRAKQRLISAWLLAVLIPALVLGATPLKLCLGFDGHRALEFVMQKAHHGLENASVQAASVQPEVAAHPDCVDVALLPAAQIAQRIAVDSRPSLGDVLPVCLVPRPIDLATMRGDPSFIRADAEPVTPPNPQLQAIRLTVLRI